MCFMGDGGGVLMAVLPDPSPVPSFIVVVTAVAVVDGASQRGRIASQRGLRSTLAVLCWFLC